MQLRLIQSLAPFAGTLLAGTLLAGAFLAALGPRAAGAEPLCEGPCGRGPVNVQSEPTSAVPSFSRFSLHLGTANLAEQKAIASTRGDVLLSSYRFTNVLVGVGYQPTEWLRIRATYTSNLNSSSELEHEAGESLPGAYSAPHYESTSASLRVRALRYGRWQVDATGALFERSIDVGSRTSNNAASTIQGLYPIHEMDPVTSRETGMSAGLNVGFALRRWADLAVSYQRIALGSMDFGPKHGSSKRGEGGRAQVSLQLDFPEEISLRGQVSSEQILSRGDMASYHAHTNEASVRLRLGF